MVEYSLMFSHTNDAWFLHLSKIVSFLLGSIYSKYDMNCFNIAKYKHIYASVTRFICYPLII